MSDRKKASKVPNRMFERPRWASSRKAARSLTAADRSALIRLASSMEKGSAERKAILAGLGKAAEADGDFLDGKLDRAWKAAMKSYFAWKRSGERADWQLFKDLKRDPNNSDYRGKMLDLHDQYQKEGRRLLKGMEAIMATAEKHPISKGSYFREAKDNLNHAKSSFKKYDPYSGWTDPEKQHYHGSYGFVMLMAAIKQLALARGEMGFPQGGRLAGLKGAVDYSRVYGEDLLPHRGIQESAGKKRRWLIEARKAFPVGALVVIQKSDMRKHIGKEGVVVGHDVGRSGEWPVIRVRLPDGKVDTFYDDEIL